MRMSSIVVISFAGLFAAITCGYLIARKYGVSVELTRNATAKARAKDAEANALLRKLAADLKLTVGNQTTIDAERGKKPLVLAVVSRRILSILVNPTGNTVSGAHSLLQKLGEVDVEPVSYSKREIPALISELMAIQSEHQTPALNGELATLIEGLKQGGDKGSEIIFY